MLKRIMFIGLCAGLTLFGTTARADSITVTGATNTTPGAPPAGYSLVNLGTSPSENAYLNSTTINASATSLGATITFNGGSGTGGVPAGLYVGSSNAAASPVLNTTTDYLVAQPAAVGAGNGTVVLTYGSTQSSFALLWGTMDNGSNSPNNELLFYDGTTLEDTVYINSSGDLVSTGLEGGSSVAIPDYSVGVTNAYVDISGITFNEVVAEDQGTASAFEFIPLVASPEPATLAFLAFGLLGLALVGRRKAAHLI
jgi:hypothetical protein